jgi:hypothetical protein
MLSGLGPFLFAATVTYMKPADPRFAYGAVLIGIGRGLTLFARLIVTQPVFAGDFAVLLLDVVQFIDFPLFLAGLFVIGLAAGGVRTRLGFAIIAVGLVLAIAKIAWSWSTTLAPLAADLPLVDTAMALLEPFLYSLGWAFVAAAAFESRRRLLLLGSLVFIALDAVLVALSLTNPGPEDDLSRVALVLEIMSLAGWLLLAVSPLRLEMGTQRPLREEAS